MSYISVPPGSPSSALQSVYELEPPAAAPSRGQVENALYRNRWLGLALIALFVGLGALATWWVRPYYVADGSIIIEHPSLHNAELTPQEFPPPVDADRELETELTVMASRTVSRPVIAALGLERRDPEIKAALDGLDQDLARRHETASPALRAEIAGDVFAGKLKLVPDKLSSTVHVDYGSHDPALAAAVVNATTQQFVRQSLAERAESGANAAAWMRQQLARALATLDGDDQAMARFQQDHGYIPLQEGGGTESALLGRLSDANHAWSAAQADRIADEAALRSYGGSVVAALPADLRNPAIDRAADNVGAAAQQLSALSTTYRPDFPLVVEAHAALAGAEQQLGALRAGVSAGLAQRLASSREREQALGSQVRELSRQAAAASGLDMQYGVLKARADGQRELTQTLGAKLDEVELEASLPPSNIQVLDAATPPLSPAYPHLPLDLGLGLGVGLLVALGIALGRERWGQVLTRPEGVTRGLGPALAPLGMIADHGRRPAVARGLLPAASGGGGHHAGYAKIAANLVARCGPPPRAVLVTSPSAGEGKTTSVCQLALALAAAGWRTLVVDADTRRPGCLAFFGLPPTSAGGLRAAEQGRKVPPLQVAPHLDLMPCEAAGGPPLQARALASLLDQWREHYDYILLDSAPGDVSGSAVLLSSLVEGVLVVLRWGRTRLPQAQQLCEDLARARAPLVGTLFNRADAAAPAFRAYRPQTAEV